MVVLLINRQTSCRATLLLSAGNRGYPYTRHLEVLDSRRPPPGRIVPEILRRVETPLVANEWERCLRNHPDGRYREYILTGLRNGFRVGFQYHTLSPTSAQTNMLSAGRNQEVVDRYLEREVSLGRVIGPLSRQEVPEVHVSRFGVIEKPHQPGKYRLIMDLSHPEGRSVNDGIEADICTLQYVSVDTAVARALAHGSAARLAKFDVESAYRVVPIHPEDRHLLGMEWKGQLFVDAALPFGLRSAPIRQ